MLMRRIPTHALVALLAIVLPATTVHAQAQGQQPGMVVFSQNKCPYSLVPQINAMADSVFAPVLGELKSEGKLIDWGILEHTWGDEWNWNVWYSVASQRAFEDFWSEYVRRLNQRHPGWFGRMAPLCTEHKDNMYSVRRKA